MAREPSDDHRAVDRRTVVESSKEGNEQSTIWVRVRGRRAPEIRVVLVVNTAVGRLLLPHQTRQPIRDGSISIIDEALTPAATRVQRTTRRAAERAAHEAASRTGFAVQVSLLTLLARLDDPVPT